MNNVSDETHFVNQPIHQSINPSINQSHSNQITCSIGSLSYPGPRMILFENRSNSKPHARLASRSGHPLHHESPLEAYWHWLYHWPVDLQVLPDWQQVGPVHPCPPHWPHFAAQLPPDGGEDVGALPELVVVVVLPPPFPPPPPELLLSLLLMKVSAACPYTEP